MKQLFVNYCILKKIILNFKLLRSKGTIKFSKKKNKSEQLNKLRTICKKKKLKNKFKCVKEIKNGRYDLTMSQSRVKRWLTLSRGNRIQYYIILQ
jgi:hypothetical protein